jgi:hypothetical protein
VSGFNWQKVPLDIGKLPRNVPLLVADEANALAVVYVDSHTPDWRYHSNDELVMHDSYFPKWWTRLYVELPDSTTRKG